MSKILVVGSGGREHAICWKLSQSPLVHKIYAVPGSYGIGQVPKTENVSIGLVDFEELSRFAVQNGVEIVVVGPEDPLTRGIADRLKTAGVKCFGPTASAAQIEGDKSWAKAFMVRHGIPTARYKSFTEPKAAKDFIMSADYNALVVKASGLAAGKGVIVAGTKEEACAAVDLILTERKFGDAGATVVVEELLEGEEVSVLGFSDGNTVKVMVPSQDHKRALDGDQGLNTGGMGAYAPCPFVDPSMLEWITKHVLQATVDGLRAEGLPFVGVLFAGLMLTSDGPKTLEFNCRLGDPETEVILPLLEGDLFEIMKACCSGSLSSIEVSFKKDVSAVGVIMSSRGYPESASKGDVIQGLEDLQHLEDILVYHCGASLKDAKLVTNGGRVLTCVALHHSLPKAAARATDCARKISFPGAHFRTDIAHKGIPRWILDRGRTSYKSSGVDIAAGDGLVEAIKSTVKGTMRPGVLESIGGFAAKYDPRLDGYKEPILLSGTDGVGTKLKVAQLTNNHSTVGQDLVAMCVNDILCSGGEPLFFLDYFATGHLDVGVASSVIQGITKGCSLAGCSLIGGETAEMPGQYPPGEYDLAGFAVGAVEKGLDLPRLADIEAGDIVVGLPSSGLHSNGFSLVRKVVGNLGLRYEETAPFSSDTLGNELLTPTRIYVKDVLHLVKSSKIKGLAHITGGGLLDNVPRTLRRDLKVHLDAMAWSIPKIFSWLAISGGISQTEMLRTFNCGIGMVLIASASEKNTILTSIPGCRVIGTVEKRLPGETQVKVDNFKEAMEPQMKVFCHSLVAQEASRKRVGVLISGSGTNLQAIIDGVNGGHIHGEIALVVSNKAKVQGLRRAEGAGIRTVVIPHGKFASREDFEREIHAALQARGVELVVLAGFMRILTPWFVRQWEGRLVNVHPALLPSFKGLDTHKRALEAGVRVTGCTVHFVNEGVDEGAIIAQRAVPILVGDTVEALQERVKAAEHEALPEAIQLICSKKISFCLDSKKVVWH